MPAGVTRLLTRARRRWFIARAIVLAAAALTIAASLLLLARIAERLLPFTADWVVAGGIAAAAAVLLALAIAWATRPRHDRIARLIDERAELRETISTALAVAARPDPWSKAALEHAEHSVRRVVLRDALPIRVPRWAIAPAIIALLIAALGYTPRTDLIATLTQHNPEQPIDGTDASIIEARADVQRTTEELRQAMAGVDAPELQQALDDLLAPNDDMTDPADIRREALKRMDELQQRLESLAGEDQADPLDQLANALKKVDAASLPDLKPLLDALQAAQFQQANEQLQRLAEMAADPNLTPEQRAALAEQLRQLAEQLEELAEQTKQELQRALEQAGANPADANNPEAIRQALEQAGLDPEQIQQLLDQAQQNQNLQDLLQQMAGECKNCAGGMKQGGQQGANNMQGMAKQLEKMQSTQEQRDAARQALRQLAESRGALGQCMSGDPEALRLIPPKFSKQGGTGAGASWARNDAGQEVDPNKYTIADQLRAESPHGDGPIVSTSLVFGDQIVGESSQRFRDAVQRAGQAATESVSNTRVPREYHEVIRRYFGELERTASPATPTTPTPAPTPAPTP